jgi:hypothetical protein
MKIILIPPKEKNVKMLFDMVTKKDATLLINWWNAHTSYYHFKRKTGKYYQVYRQL